MTWIREEFSYSWLHRLCINVLKCGDLPKHVAFIMDGNRRYARQKNVQKIKGHSQGFDKLADTLQWCRTFGIKEVTVYAFSIENFNRPEEEVEALLDLAKEKFRQLIKEEDKLREHGVRVKVIGNVSYLPSDMQELIAEATHVTEDNSECTLNVAFSYTSREEIVQAVRQAATRVSLGHLMPNQVSEEVLERLLYTSHGSLPDLLIRTSGETRLSDFLLWQSSYSVTYFTEVLWPDFNLWYLMAGIFHYQRHSKAVLKARQDFIEDKQHEPGDKTDLIHEDASIANLITKIESERLKNE